MNLSEEQIIEQYEQIYQDNDYNDAYVEVLDSFYGIDTLESKERVIELKGIDNLDELVGLIEGATNDYVSYSYGDTLEEAIGNHVLHEDVEHGLSDSSYLYIYTDANLLDIGEYFSESFVTYHIKDDEYIIINS